MARHVFTAAAALLAAGLAGGALAQSTSTVGTGGASSTSGSSSGTVGSAGSAAAGDTSASSLGVGAESYAPGQRSGSLSTGASAAAPDGRTLSRSRVRGRNGRSIGVAREGGDVSVSHTGTHLRQGELNSNTQTLARQPGDPVARSRSGSSVNLGR